MDRTSWGKRQLMRLLSAAIWATMLVVFLTRFSFSPTPPYVRSVFAFPDNWNIDSFRIEFSSGSLTPALKVYASEPQPAWDVWSFSAVEMMIMSFSSEADAVATFNVWASDMKGMRVGGPLDEFYTVNRRTVLGNRYHSRIDVYAGHSGRFSQMIYVIQACRSVLTYRVSGFGFNHYVAEAEKALTKAACP